MKLDGFNLKVIQPAPKPMLRWKVACLGSQFSMDQQAPGFCKAIAGSYSAGELLVLTVVALVNVG